MKLSEIQDRFRIEMVEIARGCPEACLHCGAYDGFSSDEMRLVEVREEDLEKNLKQVSGATGLRILECLCPYLTPHVNTEPLRVDNFLHLARLVADLTQNHSRMLAISHGIRIGNSDMERRLEKIVELMEQGLIPLFVLTVDHARGKGKINPDDNFRSYLRTLEILRSALPFGRVTASLQGTRNPESPLFIGKTREMFTMVLKQADFGPEELTKLIVDDRSYTRKGRAAQLIGLEESIDCDVIADPEFLKAQFPRDHLWRGMIRFDGTLLTQPNRPGETYGDSVNVTLWQNVQL